MPSKSAAFNSPLPVCLSLSCSAHSAPFRFGALLLYWKVNAEFFVCMCFLALHLLCFVLLLFSAHLMIQCVFIFSSALFDCTTISFVFGPSRPPYLNSAQPYLVHGVLGHNIQAAQKTVGVHEDDGHGPQGGDGEDANERVDPDGCTSDLQLQENQLSFLHAGVWGSKSSREDLPGLTSERSKLPLVHSTTLRTDRAVLRMAYCNAPTLSQNSIRLWRGSAELVPLRE